MVSAVDWNGRPDALDIVQGRGPGGTGTIYDIHNARIIRLRGRVHGCDLASVILGRYGLKAMVNGDIHVHPGAYGETGESRFEHRLSPSAQLADLFLRHGQSLTTELLPGDVENLINGSGRYCSVWRTLRTHRSDLAGGRMGSPFDP